MRNTPGIVHGLGFAPPGAAFSMLVPTRVQPAENVAMQRIAENITANRFFNDVLHRWCACSAPNNPASVRKSAGGFPYDSSAYGLAALIDEGGIIMIAELGGT